jgi:hypothetical protein
MTILARLDSGRLSNTYTDATPKSGVMASIVEPLQSNSAKISHCCANRRDRTCAWLVGLHESLQQPYSFLQRRHQWVRAGQPPQQRIAQPDDFAVLSSGTTNRLFVFDPVQFSPDEVVIDIAKRCVVDQTKQLTQRVLQLGARYSHASRSRLNQESPTSYSAGRA